MQRIERYGVIALVFLLVTILAVSLWGERKNGSVLSLFRTAPEAPPIADADGLLASDEPPALVVGERRATSRDLPLAQGDPGAWTAPPFHPHALEGAAPGTPGDATSLQERPEDLAERSVLDPAPVPTALPPSRDTRPSPKAPQPAPAGSRSYTVKSGETLGEIAQRELGTWRRWTEIQALNGGLDPSRLRAGMTLNLPEGARAGSAVAKAPPAKQPPPTKSAAAQPAPSGRGYVVRAGDTLSAIAARELGDGERWRDIQQLNPKVDPRRLLVGQRLALPAGERAAQRPLVVASSDRKASDGPRVR